LDSDLVVETSSNLSLTGHWRAPQKYFPNYPINLLFGFDGNHALMVADLLSCLHDVALFVLFE